MLVTVLLYHVCYREYDTHVMVEQVDAYNIAEEPGSLLLCNDASAS